LTGLAPVHVSTTAMGGLAGLKRRLGTGTIYLAGGGNFGDLWRGHQELRERILAGFPQHRIVQLPQSIHYRSAAAAARLARAIGRHGGFHLLVRDRSSATFARRHFDCPIELAPDCAFGLGPLAPTADPRHRLLCLRRTDQEQVAADWSATVPLRPRTDDWVREPRLPMLRLKAAAVAARLLPGRDPDAAAAGSAFDRLARLRVARGVALLSTGRQVITDRLHGHILCAQLGIPHVALDNSYGKISAYYRDWTNGLECAEFAADPKAAVAALSGLAERTWQGPAAMS
jgi:pyruvyl transferase EpsO